MRRSFTLIVSLLVMLSVLLAACTPAATSTQAAEPTAAAQAATIVPAAAADTLMAGNVEVPEIDPSMVTGNLVTAGSSTVYPLTEAVVSLFQSEGYAGQVTIESIGSGAGFERFCKGETDVANASRAIKDSEVETCKAIGLDPIEFRVGTDAMAVVVNPKNTFLTNVTVAELATIFSDQATNWSDVNPDWPAQPIKRYTPGTDSGTYDYFIEVIMTPAYEDDAELAMTAFQNAANLQQSEDDNVLVQGIEGDEYSIGFFGFAYYQEEGSKLTALSIEDVSPNAETAEDGSYALARPLFIYSSPTIMAEKPQVAQFITFYLSRVNEVIDEVGYFPASDEALSEAAQNLLDATAQ
jgi:phosphate transport system substrate-binding protein